MSTICKRVSLGTTGRVRESKVEFGSGFPPSVTVRCRDGWHEAYAEFCGPDVTLESVWGEVQECARYAAAIATLVAIFASPQGALPAFKAAFYMCLKAKVAGKADEITVGLSASHESSDWGSC